MSKRAVKCHSADAGIAASLQKQEFPRSLYVTEEECNAGAGIAASLQELPRGDCSNDELIARQLAGMNIESPERASVPAINVEQGGRTKAARKNHARHERRRQQRAAEETRHTNWRVNARNNHANNIERLLNEPTAHLAPGSLADHELQLMRSLRMHADLAFFANAARAPVHRRPDAPGI